MAYPVPVIDRFWSKVDRSAGPDACWLWQGARLPKGYGHMKIGGRSGQVRYAHRVSWELAFGPIPTGLQVCHRCDNPPCANPDHLFLGTPAENTADMVAKGRARGGSNRGEAHPAAKLTEADVRKIRALAAAGLTNVEIASRFNVSVSTSRYIVRRKLWRHVA